MTKYLIFLLLSFLLSLNSYSQNVIGEGTRFEQDGVTVSGNYKVMWEKEVLHSIVVDENGKIYIFEIVSETQRDNTEKSVSLDLNCKNKDDKYYLSLTVSKIKQKSCLLLVFDGTKENWYPEKVAVRSYGFSNYFK